MDERQLTAWLITHGVVTPPQAKELLEEQLRLERAGEKQDVIQVARRLGLIPDSKLVEVLEQTGYAPPRPAAAAVKLEAPAGAGPAAPAPPPPPPTAPLDASESSVAPIPLGDAPVPPARSTSGPRRRRGTSSASMQAAARRKKNDANGMLIMGGAAVVALFLMLALLPSGPRPGDTGEDVATDRPGRTERPSDQEVRALLTALRDDVSRLEIQGGPPSDVELARLERIVARLEALGLQVSQAQSLAKTKARMDALRGGGSGTEPEVEPLEPEVDAAEALASLGERLERTLWLSLQQRRSRFQLALEAVRGKNLRREVGEAIKQHAERGAEGLIELAQQSELHPVLGVGGYDTLLRALERLPSAVRDGAPWSDAAQQLALLRRRASTYTRALLVVDEASERGDIETARLAFSGDAYADDPWFQTARTFLQRADVAAAFERRAGQLGGVTELPGGAGGASTSTGAATSWGADWRERFLAISRRHRKAKGEERQQLSDDLKAVVEETLARSRESFAACSEVVAFYDDQTRVFKAAPELQPLLKEIHTLYFEAALANASGPAAFRALDAWCEGYAYSAWRAQIKPYLRLVAAATGRAARAREGKRNGRAQAQEVVAEFANERVASVAEGVEAVVDWMRKRGYAPDDAKTELGDFVARAIERSGDPVQGARLREEVKALENTAEADEVSGLAKGFRKQLDGVIRSAVSRSLKAVEKCVGAGEPGLAFDLFQYVLLIDPENDRAHKGLGHVKVDGRWLRRFDAERLRAGYEWDGKLAWVRVADRARYAKGDYYDLQSKGWTTVAAANQAHADPGSPWVVRSEHFELRSTADLPETARVVERLEAFYLQLFRQYDLFFASKGGAALIFGMSPSQSEPLVVNYYRTQQQFKQHASPPTDWAAGFYDSGRAASFFYSSRDWTTLQHEIVHQILGESSPGGSDAWLAEGAAVFLEDAFFQDGMLTLGERRHHSRVVAYQNNLRGGGAEHSLLDMLAFKTSADWDSGDIAKNYRGAGAVVYFLCSFDGGRYRSDFVEYLRAAYNRQKPKLEEFFGLPPAVLSQLMRRFYDPKAKVDLPGGGTASAEDLNAARDAMVSTCGAKHPDLDQLTTAYAMLRQALNGAADEKEANKARSRAAKALASTRKKAAARVERAIRQGIDNKGLAARWQKLQQLRAAAIAIIQDLSVYPDENHGAVGQPKVDAKVDALKAFWSEVPPVFEEPEVAADMELLEATEPWLDELEVAERRRGKSALELREELARKAGAAGMAPTAEARDLQALNAKVRRYNAELPGVPEDARAQVRALNDYRIMLGLEALTIDLRLQECAKKHSDWMLQAGDMTHDEPTPARRTPTLRAQQEGYTGGVGENVAFGYTTPDGVHEGWYRSSGHHRNMIHKDWHQVGVARAGTYWTQNFGTEKTDHP